MSHIRFWALLISAGLIAVSCTSAPQGALEPDSVPSTVQNLVVPPNGEPNSFVRGTLIDPKASGITPIYYEAIDQNKYHTPFKDATDSTKHFTVMVPMGVKELDVSRKVAPSGAIVDPARCLIDKNLQVPGIRKLHNIPAAGPAIIGGTPVFERNKLIVLQTRGMDARLMSVQADGSSHGIQILGASSTSVVLQADEGVPLGTHNVTLLSAGKESNALPADFIDVQLVTLPSPEDATIQTATLSIAGLDHPATVTFRVKDGTLAAAGASTVTVPVTKGKASVQFRSQASRQASLSWKLDLDMRGPWG